MSHSRSFSLIRTYILGVVLSFIVSIVGLSALPTSTFGQTLQQPTLATSPQYPGPDQSVTVTLQTFGITTTGATIQWYEDGKELSDAKNLRSVVVRTKSKGASSKIEARITQVNGKKLTAERIIIPGSVDIVVEPETYVPMTYEGRALPVAGSDVHLVAMPELYENGKLIPASELTYTWSDNGSVLFGGPVTGKQDVVLTMPRFSGTTVSVIVRKKDGTRYAKDTVALRAERPFVLFYEESSLYGTIPSAPSSLVVPKEEITLRAEPFYASLKPGSPTYQWTVDGKTVEPTSSDPFLITLRQIANAVSATIGFSYNNNGGTLEYGQGTIKVSFTSGSFINQ